MISLRSAGIIRIICNYVVIISDKDGQEKKAAFDSEEGGYFVYRIILLHQESNSIGLRLIQETQV